MTARHLSALATLAALCPALSAQDGDDTAQRLGLTGAFPEASSSSAFVLTPIYVNTPGHPTNTIPSLGVGFLSGGSSTSAFIRPWVSANGQQVVIEAKAATGSTTTGDVYLLNGVVVLQEGTQAPWAPMGETVGTLDDRVGIDNAGNLLLGNNAGGTATSTADDYLVLLPPGGGAPTVIAKEGDLVDTLLPALAGATWDDQLASPVLVESGGFAFEADGLDNLPASALGDNVLIDTSGSTISAGQVPLGQAGGATAPWQNFDFDDFYITPDGTQRLLQGDTDAAIGEDDILALNGTVVLQEGFPIPGGPFAEAIDQNGIVKGWLDTAGNWYARGNNDLTEQDWIIRNGTVIAFSDGLNPIVPGSTESWDDTDFGDCFFLFDGNASGAFVIGGLTDAPSDANAVLVLDDGTGNRFVLCRENDPIDLDGNGMFDDDRFFNTFGNDDLLLLDDGRVLFTATMRDSTGNAVDQGFFELDPNAAGCTVRNGSGINPLDFRCVTSPTLGTVWQSVIATNSSTALTGMLFTLSPLQPAIPLFGGELLIDVLTNPFGTRPGVAGAVSLSLPNDPNLVGAPLFTQGVRVDGIQIVLTNGLDLTLSF